MSWLRRLDLIDPYTCSPIIVRETSIVEPSSLLLGFPSFIDDDNEVEDLFDFSSPSPLDLFETVTDLVQIEKSPSSCKYKLIRRRLEPDYPLKYLCDKVSDLESKFDRLVSPKSRDCDRKYTLTKEIKGSGERKYRWEAEIQGPPERKYKVEAEMEGSAERKYKWEAEIEGPGERKYKWTTEIKGGKKDEERQRIALKKEKAKAIAAEAEKKKKTKKSYNWTTEVKSERENGEVSHTYMIKASTGGEKGKHEEKEKKDKKEKKSKKKEKTRVVAIEEEEEEENESEEHGAIVLRKLLGRIASKDPLMAAPWQWENATAGAVAGFATVAAIHPLDVVRTRFQVNDGRGSSLPTYKNTAHAVFTIGRLEGLRGLYAGFFPAVIGSTVSWGLYFYFYGRAKQRYAKGRDDEKLSPGLHLASAAEAGALVCLCTNPIWLVKTRLQLQTPLHRTQPYSGLLDAFRTIVKEEGPRALYKGIVPGLVLVSHGAIQFTAYEELRKIIVDLKERRRKSESADNILNSADYAALGGSSKVAAVLLTYPFQVIRARLQQRPSTNGIPRYIDSLHVIRETARFEGLRGFYRGLTANLLKNVPASSITFIVYENVLKLLKQPPTKD